MMGETCRCRVSPYPFSSFVFFVVKYNFVTTKGTKNANIDRWSIWAEKKICEGLFFGSGPVEGVELAVFVELVPYRAPADCTAIFVFVSFGQYKKKGFPHRDGPSALQAVEFGGLELVEARLLAGTGLSFYRRVIRLVDHDSTPEIRGQRVGDQRSEITGISKI
jgi:hypothetical protein